MKQKIAVVFGGSSSEHEISLMSATFVINNLPRDRFDLLLLGIRKDGCWFLYEGGVDDIITGAWERHPKNRPAFLCPDSSVHGVVATGPTGYEPIRVDAVFPVLHGKNGEDGTLQGLLTLAGIPFVGCPTLSSSVTMDKGVTHTLLTAAGVKQANYLWFYAENYAAGKEKIKTKITARLGWPIYLKPANAGSSVGISKVNGPEELDAAFEKAAAEDGKIVVEEAIVGQEVECAVLGNLTPEASPVGEIAATDGFYDYDDKYKNNTSQLYIPARLAPEVAEELRSIAKRAYRMLGCMGLARVDFFVRGGKEILLNEVNTMPGFTSISMYPKLWEAAGLSGPRLVTRLVELALERAGE